MKNLLLLLGALLVTTPLAAPAATPPGADEPLRNAAAPRPPGAAAAGTTGQAAPSGQPPTGGQSVLDEPAGQLRGEAVHSPEGETLGTIEQVVRERTNKTILAVVSVGGFLGIGAHRVTVPVQQIQRHDGKLVLSTTMTTDELKNEPPYRPAAGEPVDSNETLRAAIDERIPTLSARIPDSVLFNRLDDDGDGRLSRDEASADARLADQWTSADKNNDGWIERSEFETFSSR